jgi:hypothetical protein
MQQGEPRRELTTDEIRYAAPTDFGQAAAIAVLGVSAGKPSFVIRFALLTGAYIVSGLLGVLPFGRMWRAAPAAITAFSIIFLLIASRSLRRILSA